MIGDYLRGQREQRKIGLRELARRMHYTPSYLSKVERDVYEPGEECLLAYAQHLHLDSDLLLLRAGRISREVAAALVRNPEVLKSIREMPGE